MGGYKSRDREIRHRTLLSSFVGVMDRQEVHLGMALLTLTTCISQALFIHRIIPSQSLVIDYKVFMAHTFSKVIHDYRSIPK